MPPQPAYASLSVVASTSVHLHTTLEPHVARMALWQPWFEASKPSSPTLTLLRKDLSLRSPIKIWKGGKMCGAQKSRKCWRAGKRHTLFHRLQTGSMIAIGQSEITNAIDLIVAEDGKERVKRGNGMIGGNGEITGKEDSVTARQVEIKGPPGWIWSFCRTAKVTVCWNDD
jgi:hypothetical protein